MLQADSIICFKGETKTYIVRDGNVKFVVKGDCAKVKQITRDTVEYYMDSSETRTHYVSNSSNLFEVLNEDDKRYWDFAIQKNTLKIKEGSNVKVLRNKVGANKVDLTREYSSLGYLEPGDIIQVHQVHLNEITYICSANDVTNIIPLADVEFVEENQIEVEEEEDWSFLDDENDAVAPFVVGDKIVANLVKSTMKLTIWEIKKIWLDRYDDWRVNLMCEDGRERNSSLAINYTLIRTEQFDPRS